MLSDTPAIVIDNGSGVCKAGFAGDDAPRSVIPSIIGRPKNPLTLNMATKELFVGDEALEKKGLLLLTNPIERGLINNWDDMTKLWHHVFYNELRVATEEHVVMISEMPQTPVKIREKIAEIMFENFNVPGLSFGLTSVLALYASGKFTGLVVDSGNSQTYIVPIFEGYSIYNGLRRVNFAGDSLTQFMSSLLTDKGIHLTTSAEKEIARDIKESFGYVAMNFEEELKSGPKNAMLKKTYLLPDGEKIELNEERFKCPEALFKPNLMGIEGLGIDQAIYKSISNCDIDLRKNLYGSIVLSGGNTMFPGFESRLEKELINIIPKSNKVKIIAQPERKYFVWFGGSIFSSLNSFLRTIITKEAYMEHGEAIISGFDQSMKL